MTDHSLNLNSLRSRFSARGVEIDNDAHGLTRLTVTTRAAAARLYLQGAHVTHYQPTGAAPVLFTSERSLFTPGKPIRGGVPLVFPWFGPHPTDATQPAHGWARTSAWELQSVTRDSADHVTVILSLGVGELSLRPIDGFTLIYTVRVGPELVMLLDVQNTLKTAATFEAAFHTYLAVSDVRQVRIDGLDGRSYLDKVDAGRRKTQSGPITITGETDRVYVDSRDVVTVNDPGAGRTIVVEKEGSATTVLWNPWVEKARRMSDFGDDEWPKMLCIETANAADNAVTLAAGARHTMRAKVRFR